MKKITLFLLALISVLSVNAQYLKGTFNGWGTGNKFSSGQTTINLTANTTYEFKINEGNSWYGNDGTMDIGNCSDWTFEASQGNAKIRTLFAGNYTFKWNSSSRKVSVIYPTGYCITGTSKLVSGSGWQATEKIMTKSGSTYTYTFPNLAAGEYEFKITNGTWNTTFGYSDLDYAYQGVTSGENNNIKLNLTEKTNLTITFNGSKITLDLPKKEYTVYYVNSSAWSNVNAYVWDAADNDKKAWPGESMTKISGKTYKGKDVYQYTFSAKYTNIIFSNNGSSQTSNLTITEGKFYYYDSKWNTSINYDVIISVSANPAEGGTVTGEGTYNHGSTATLIATPNPGYKFVKWNDDETAGSTRTITVTQNATYQAVFEKLPEATFSDPSILTIGTTYGQLTYQLTMNENRWYWVSFPFNVNINAITTSTGNGSGDLFLTEYNAQKRATDGNGGWQNVAYKTGDNTQLIANKGYVIGPADNAFVKGMVVTFPSATATNEVKGTLTLKTEDTKGDTKNDNWHIVGTGLYHEAASLGDIKYVAIPTIINNKEDYKYYYVGESNQNDQFNLPISQHTFRPFEAFFVQYGGEYTTTAKTTKTAAELAPVARAKAQQNEQIYCLNMNETHTVVILNAEGSEGYTVGQDFLEMNGDGNDLIYSFDGNDALAFNHRAIEAQSIALGGYVATAGEQTISLNSYNANAEAVTLIDNQEGTTTDLLTNDYTFTAERGSLDGRFSIVFAAQKAGDTTVDCYNAIENSIIAYGAADNCTVTGLTAGSEIAIYNTLGQLVFATTANAETINLPSLVAGTYLIRHNNTIAKITLR